PTPSKIIDGQIWYDPAFSTHYKYWLFIKAWQQDQIELLNIHFEKHEKTL
ncbi:hypothetical protein LCGC14_2772950, partial [marine sediment metagenome]